MSSHSDSSRFSFSSEGPGGVEGGARERREERMRVMGEKFRQTESEEANVKARQCEKKSDKESESRDKKQERVRIQVNVEA